MTPCPRKKRKNNRSIARQSAIHPNIKMKGCSIEQKKNMKKTTFAKPLIMRLVLAALLLATLCSVFVGCSGGAVNTLTVSVSDIEHDESTNGIGKLELKEIANFLASDTGAREAFVAAYRGYDMTEENFDLKADRPALDPSVEAAKNVLKKFDEKTKKLADVDYAALNEADMLSVVNALKTTVDLDGKRGFLDTIQYGIGIVLRAITGTVGFGSYIVGICLFAIVIEILMLPFAIKQQKNSIKQASLRPKEMAIRKKYAGRNDQATQQKVSQEIQELYQRENFNPMGGCLPLLLQFPIVIILYNIVVDPVRYVLGLSSDFSAAITGFCTTAKAAGGLGVSMSGNSRGTIEALSHITELIRKNGMEALSSFKEFLFLENGSECFAELEGIQASIPSFAIGELNFGLVPSIQEWPLLFVPLFTFLVYFFSMKITRKFSYQPTQSTDPQMQKQQGCSNNMMDITMPLMSVYIAFITPAAVGVYWIFRSMLNTLKSFIMSRAMPLPKFTEEDYKAAEKEMKARAKGQAPKATNRSSDGTRPRSLHHIDDDDEQPAPAPKKNEKVKETELAPAPLKDENDKPNHNNEGQEE